MILDLLAYIAEGVVLFTFVFLLKSLYELTDLFVAGGTNFSTTFQLLFSLLPSIMLLTFPMAVLLASLMLYGRMTQDNEITALQAGGYSTYQLVIPAIIVGILLTAVLLWWGNRIAPKGLRLFRAVAVDVLKDTATTGIRPGGFNKLGDFVFFPSEVDEGKMTNLRLFESRLEKDKDGFELERVSGVVSSPTATIHFSPSTNTLTLQLKEGTLHQVPQADRDVVIRFGSMEFTIGIPSLLSKLAKFRREEQIYSSERLQWEIEKTEQDYERFKQAGDPTAEWWRQFWKRCEVEKARRVALPFACLFMAVIGAVLGMESRFGKRSSCYAMTIVVILFYYILLSLGKAYAEDGVVPAWLGIWIPNLISGVIALALLQRTQRV